MVMVLDILREKLRDLKEKGYGNFKVEAEEYIVCGVEVDNNKKVIEICGHYINNKKITE